MKIRVDRNKCSGIGLCEAMSPDFFEVDDGGLLRFSKAMMLPTTCWTR
jgi:ferredoxin